MSSSTLKSFPGCGEMYLSRFHLIRMNCFERERYVELKFSNITNKWNVNELNVVVGENYN